MGKEQFVDHIDRFGLIVQKDGDSGDTAQRVGTYWTLTCLMLGSITILEYWDYIDDLKALRVSPGRYRRTADPEHWGYGPANFSRDQHAILNLSMAVLGSKKELKISVLEIIKRFGFHQNYQRGTDDPEEKWKCPDWITPSQISVAIRGLDLWYLYPCLAILDLGFLADLVLRGKSNDYDNMMAQNLFYAISKYPTLVGKLAFYFYCKTDFMDRIKAYHVSENGIPPLYDLYVECFNYIKGKNH